MKKYLLKTKALTVHANTRHNKKPYVTVALGVITLAISAFATVRTWVGTGGEEDWSLSENWSGGNVADGDDVAVFVAPSSGSYEFIHYVTPPASFTGTIVTSNELAFTTSWWTLMGPVEVVAEIVPGAAWKIGGNGTFVACEGFESHVPSTFVGKLVIPKGITFTAPADLNSKVLLAGAGTLILTSPAQLSQALAFTGDIVMSSGDMQLSNLADFANHSVRLADGQTVSLSGHDSSYSSIDPIESFADAPEKWTFNGSISTSDDGTKKVDGSDYPEGAYNRLPPYVTDGVLYLTDDPSQCHTVWYTNRYFRGGDEIGMKFRWTPSLPQNPHVEGAGRASLIDGVFSVCMQGESPTNCTTGRAMSEMYTKHSEGTFGFFVYTYRGDGYAYVGWSTEKQYASRNQGIGEAALGISLHDAIDFAVTVDKNGMMTVTLIQGEKSVTFTKDYSTQIFTRTAKGFYIGFTGSSSTWGYSYSRMPWVSHQISGFQGWCRSDYGGNWKKVENAADFALNSENWQSIQGVNDGSCTTNGASVFEADGTVKLVTTPATMTMLASKSAVVDRTLPTKLTIDISGGAITNGASGNSGKIGISFGLLQVNNVTWRPTWKADGYYEIVAGSAWLYGMLYSWNLTDGRGRYYYSQSSGATTSGTLTSGVSGTSGSTNIDVHVELVLDPALGFRSRLTRSPAAYGNGTVKNHEWELDETLLNDWNNPPATLKHQLFLRAVAGSKDYSQMTLKNLKVEQIAEPQAGFLAGELTVPAGASVVFNAGESPSGQTAAFVRAKSVVLGADAALTVAPEKSCTSLEVQSLSVSGRSALLASAGASVAIGELTMSGNLGNASLETSGAVTFAPGLKIHIPDSWVKVQGRHVIVDMGAGGEFPMSAQILTSEGKDVTSRAHLAVAGGNVLVCFDRGFIMAFR